MSIIDAQQALQIAHHALQQSPVRSDPLFAPWPQAVLGQPLQVMTVFRQPSYWLVPVLIRNRAAGFVRILPDGTVSAVGAFYRDPSKIESSPLVVTGISAAEASLNVRALVHAEQGEVAEDPVFVHDGPPGREAWLVEVRRQGHPTRWIFAGPGGVYERPAGQARDESLE